MSQNEKIYYEKFKDAVERNRKKNLLLKKN